MISRISLCAMAAIAAMGPSLARAASLSTLYSFGPANSGDAAEPSAGPILDGAGNLYGVTYAGGAGQAGAVFEVSPPPAGQTAWTEVVLQSFGLRGATDGAHPMSRLLLAPDGSLYGTTNAGGGPANDEGGTVFRLAPPAAAGGAWTETVLHVFKGGRRDGAGPSGALAMDSAGAVYGVTTSGGLGPGILYKLTPPAAGRGQWTETILHEFSPTADHAYGPSSGPVIDAGGGLYLEVEPVNALHGGSGGAVASFTAAGGGSWAETIVEMFPTTGRDGFGPIGGLAIDSAGALYGATSSGGKKSDGVVFRLEPPAGGGGWTLSVLASFTGAGGLEDPASGVALGTGGSVVGVADGQTKAISGSVFQLTPAGGSPWPQSVLASFGFKTPGGVGPTGVLAVDASGDVYGVTGEGGMNGAGTVFEVTP